MKRYTNLINKSIQKEYKKALDTVTDNIDQKTKTITKQLELDDRITSLPHNTAYVTIKDHKASFLNNPQCRLINPTKSEIRKISKSILDNINTKLRTAPTINQWESTHDILNWFKTSKNKNESTFINVGIVNFYPSYSEDLLQKALRFAATHVNITPEDVKILMHARISLLHTNKKTWIKKIINVYSM